MLLCGNRRLLLRWLLCDSCQFFRATTLWFARRIGVSTRLTLLGSLSSIEIGFVTLLFNRLITRALQVVLAFFKNIFQSYSSLTRLLGLVISTRRRGAGSSTGTCLILLPIILSSSLRKSHLWMFRNFLCLRLYRIVILNIQFFVVLTWVHYTCPSFLWFLFSFLLGFRLSLQLGEFLPFKSNERIWVSGALPLDPNKLVRTLFLFTVFSSEQSCQPR